MGYNWINGKILKIFGIGLFMIAACIQAIQFCSDPGCAVNCPERPCHHGNCNEEGACVCDVCWGGDNCDQAGANAVPYFLNSHFDVQLTTPISFSKPIATVKAFDTDEGTCQSESHDECPCARILYKIESGNEKGVFSIDEPSGEIFLTGSELALEGNSHELVVSAQNPAYGGAVSGVRRATVTVHRAHAREDLLGMHEYAGFQAEYDNIGYSEAFPESTWNQPHHRSRRDINTDLTAYSPGVDNVTFHLEKTGDYENVTEMQIGHKVHFLLAIQFPVGTTSMLVELFTPDNETTVMVLCNVLLEHVGSRLEVDGVAVTTSSFPVVREAKTTDSYDYDRAIIDFGNITNAGSAVSATEEMVILEWDAVLIDNPDTDPNEVYWVSAGAEYNYESDIWVGQASFSVNTTMPTVVEVPTFNFTGPCEIPIGASSVFQLDLYIPYPSKHIYVDGFAPLDQTEAISVCSALVTDTGAHYSCLPKDYLNFDSYSDGRACSCNERVRLDLGTVTNAGWNEADPWEANRITVEFAFYTFSSAVVGSNYTIHAAVQIDEQASEIWAGSLDVTVVSSDTVPSANLSTTPTLSMATMTDSEVVVDQAVVYELTLAVPQGEEGTFSLEVLAPYNDSAARMSICNVSVVSQGVNVPCFTDQEPVYTSRDDSNVTDRVQWSLGRIRNTGHRDSSIDTAANNIVFRIVASVLNHSLNTVATQWAHQTSERRLDVQPAEVQNVGESLWLTAGMDIDSDMLWVGTNSLTIVDSNNVSTAADAPVFSLNYTMGDDTVAIGASTNISLTIATQADNIHDNVDVEIIMPFYDNAPLVKICKVEVMSSGVNLPCFNRAEKNASIQYESKVNTSDPDYDPTARVTYDRALLSLGSLCNTGIGSEPEDNELQLYYTVQLLDHPNVTDGWTDWLNEGVAYSNTFIWVGQISMQATTDPQNYPLDVEPEFNLTRGDDALHADLGKGYSATYQLDMKLPPQSTANFVVTVQVTDGMSACHVRVVEVGSSFPCLAPEDFSMNVTEHAGAYYRETVFLDMGPVSNVGDIPLSNSTEFDENTIRLEATVKMLDDTTAGQTVTVTVDYGDQQYQQQLSLTPVDVISIETGDDVPNVTLTVWPVNENQSVTDEIAKGQTLLYRLDLEIPAGSEHDYTVKFLSPIDVLGVLEVCSLAVVQVGANLPCLIKQELDDTTTYRTDSTFVDIRTLTLGHVCHKDLVSVEDDPDANHVILEAAVRATRSGERSPGDALLLSATVKINDDSIFVAQQEVGLTLTEDFNETDHDLNAGDISLANNLDALPVSGVPGEVLDIPVLITVPPNASINAYLDVETPVNTTAQLTVHHIEVSEAGSNIGCMAGNSALEFNTTYNSTQATTQNNYAVFDLGILTNTGMTYRKGTWEEADDQLTVLVQIQMTDAQENADTEELQLSLGLSMGRNVYILDKYIAVERDFSELPDIVLEAEVNETVTYDVGEQIVINARLSHTNQSSAEGYNTTAAFYFPPFMRFRRITANNFTEPTVTNSSQAGVSFMFDRLFFTDIAEFTFEIDVVPDEELPFTEVEVNSTSPFESGSNIIYRDTHVNDSGTWFVSRLDQLSFVITGPTGVGCVDVPLGMESGDIRDCQLSGSHSVDNTEATDARLNGGSGWSPGIRAGDFMPYIQVALGNTTRVVSVTLAHDVTTTCRVSALEVRYSDDAVVWTPLLQSVVVPGVTNPELVELPVAVEGKHVQLLVADHDCTDEVPQLTAELHGCVALVDASITDICAANAFAWGNYLSASELYSRGMLATSNSLYFCDEMPSGRMECFMSSTGSPREWVTINEVVMNVLGYNSATGELYGIAWDRRSFMLSRDEGATWFSVAYERYTQAVSDSANWLGATEIPWTTTPAFGPHITTDGYTSQATMAARYDGIYDVGTSSQLATWDTCCA